MARLARLLFLGLGALPLLAGPPCFSASADKDLEGIKKKIETEKRGISQVQKKEGSVLHALDEIQSELAQKNKELQQANSRLNSVLSEMRQKESDAERIQASLQQRQALFAKRAVALYRWQRGGSPFVILNGDVSLGVLLRRKHYLEATLAFDRELLQSLNEQAARHELVKTELARKKEEVDLQRRRLAEVREATRREADKKSELLASLRQEKEVRVRALKELEQAALRLQKMMDEIARRAVRKPGEISPGVGLARMRGKLDWPVKGHVVGGFGKTRHREFSAELFRKGIDIEAPVGEEIKAVEKGKVIFADRFSGYGKMLIIDHGERYYTIYAHLSEFLKKTGDSVARGEAIALVGDSDSLAGAKLYFEMRKDGKSIDPLPWFGRQ
jgi:septal ring factor EnvC (AmiA/AmiB activator)